VSSNLQNNTGLFIPTTNIWELDQLQSSDLSKDAIRELLVRLYQNVNNIAIALNLKDSGYYFQQEFINGQLLFVDPSQIAPNLNGRQIFRTVVNFGSLPNTTTTSVPHNIDVTQTFSFTRIYGVASDPVNFSYIPLPYSSTVAVANNIELYVDSNNVNITTGIDQSAYTISYVILEYVKE
jgi:hypothetical protein